MPDPALGVIDCDVHHGRHDDGELLEHLPASWRDYINGPRPGHTVPLTVSDGYPNPHGFMRKETYPESGGEAGSDLRLMDEQLLTPTGTARAILTYGDDIHVSGLHNPYFAAVLAHALNDWTIDRWLTQDERLAGSIIVACQLPEEAAKEVRRMAGHPGMVQVLLADNPSKHPFGHPIFHPIYAAAAEAGLPVAIHAGANDWANPPSTGGGTASTYIEAHTLWPQAAMTHLVSFIAHGVFELFPQLKLVLLESGAAWIPPLLWRYDAEYRGLHREIPWCRRLPSEYFTEHVWVSTQPLEISPRREHLIELLASVGAQDKLVYSSDYPHWDADEITYLQTRLPTEWHDRVFRDNARALYGWSAAELPAVRGTRDVLA
jgi:predicted TIM-barrel fold metal-dependent hydrolase